MRRFSSLFLAVFIFSLLLGACQNSASKKMVDPKAKNLSNHVNLTDSEHRVMANRFSNLAREVSGVERAVVIIVRSTINEMDFAQDTPKDAHKKDISPGGGLTVIIGANLDEGAKNDEAIKEEIKKRVRASEVKVSQVFVTFEPAIVGQIDDVAAGTLQGESLAEHEKEIKEILTKLSS